ncbi:DUF1707 SHOCT-like domain-containing protein [Streptomyces sp. TR06-5]|uniref:DUF1707 SHOCT-like domain-containing protein n=1 Tax=unclassified Streptomyces TaxID=2593676 RepID=UPI0039A06FEE
MSQDRNLRASDADREQVVQELGDHLAAGRLDTAEFEERATKAQAARTLAQLDEQLADLPAERERPGGASPVPPEGRQPATVAHAPAAALRHGRAGYGSWLSVSLVVTAVWGFSSLAAGELQSFWPVWVIGPWGLAILVGHGFGRAKRRR